MLPLSAGVGQPGGLHRTGSHPGPAARGLVLPVVWIRGPVHASRRSPPGYGSLQHIRLAEHR